MKYPPIKPAAAQYKLQPLCTDSSSVFEMESKLMNFQRLNSTVKGALQTKL
jgi:hypothetical protein